MMMIAQVYLGRAEMYRGNLSVAEQLLLEARDLSEGDGMRDLRSMPRHYLGLTYLEQGRQQEAIQTLQEALDGTRELRPLRN
jgi:tetratricopeptide (TPR) repeat protein